MTKEPDFGAVDPRYRQLYARALDVFGADDRVARVEVSGSIADGTADEWSDLDLKVIVRDDAIGAFLDEWRDWMNKITPTVLLDRPIAPFIVNAVTDGGLTFDVSVWTESAPEWTPPPGFTVGFVSGRRFENHADAITYAVEERLRGLAGPGIRLAKRGDFVLHLATLGHTIGLLMEVLLAEVDAVPEDPRHPERYLTPEQRAVFTSLPPVTPTYDGLLNFEMALARETLTRARPLFDRFGLEWPTALEAVAARNVRDHLGLEFDWLRA
jgi:predicted nucleotidyltransferase